jgi:hypothetical protein
MKTRWVLPESPVRYLRFPMKPGGPWFKLRLSRGDDFWAPHVWLEHWWPGGGLWHLWFFLNRSVR